MRQRFKKAWLLTKLALICVVVIWVTLFFVSNSDNTTNVWLFFGVKFKQVSLDWIVPLTAVAAILIFYVVRKVTAVLGQLSQIRLLQIAVAAP